MEEMCGNVARIGVDVLHVPSTEGISSGTGAPTEPDGRVRVFARLEPIVFVVYLYFVYQITDDRVFYLSDH